MFIIVVYNRFQVTMSFFRFFWVYFFFLMAYGLGFYVSLEKLRPDDKNSTSASNVSSDEEYKPFSTGVQAFVKTSAMFSGELVSSV